MPIPDAGRIHERLSKRVARIEELEGQRALLLDWEFGRAEEERIVFAELLDLEMQAIDEQIEESCSRLCRAVDHLHDHMRR